MKTLMYRSAIFLLLIGLAPFTPNGFAQNTILEGNGHETSGGGGEDILFKSVRDEIGGWLQKNLHLGTLENKLSLTSIKGEDLVNSYEAWVKSVGNKIVFNHDEIRFGQNVRICKNNRASMTITCNIDEWAKTNGKVRYAIVFHEYLGLAELESNVETDYSRYPISGKLIPYVKTSEAFELGMEQQMMYSAESTAFMTFMKRTPSPSTQEVLEFLLQHSFRITNCRWELNLTGEQQHSFKEQGILQKWVTVSYTIQITSGSTELFKDSNKSFRYNQLMGDDNGDDVTTDESRYIQMKEQLQRFRGNRRSDYAISKLYQLVESGVCETNPYTSH